MKTAKMTLVSTVVAAALGLALGLAAPPAVADQVNKPGGEHNHAKKGEPLLDVTVLISPGHDTMETECEGLTVPQGGLSADIFSSGLCVFSMTDFLPVFPAEVGDRDTLYAYRVEVKKSGKKASETTGSIYFTTNPDFFPGSDGDIYVSEILRLLFADSPPGDCDIYLTPLPPLSGRLIKVLQPGKGELTSAGLLVELLSICYELND